MKRFPGRTVWALVLALLSAALASWGARADAPAEPPESPRGVMVAFQPEASPSRRVSALARVGIAPDQAVGNKRMARVALPMPLDEGRVREIVSTLRQDPAIRVAEPDYRVRAMAAPNDTDFRLLWGLHNSGQTGGLADADIDAMEAWELTTGSASVVVAVIDTGVDYTHPDLRDNILRNSEGGPFGYDFINEDPDPMDDAGHGTHVAGTIGARGNNGAGITGVCQNVRIMPLKFLDVRGGGSVSDAIECIDFAIDNGAHVMSNSWGGGGYSELLREAIQRARKAGILFVAASGNDASDNDDEPTYPASYRSECDNVLSVAASDDSDALAGFSNFGRATVDLAAPGTAIRSTLPGGAYGLLSGTSMAAPHVSGVAALILSQYPTITPIQLRTRLLANVDRPASLHGRVRAGRLNAHAALLPDPIAPGAPGSFSATHRSSDAVRLSWVAPGDDAMAGTAAGYDLRYSPSPIDALNFTGALPASAVPDPAPARTTQAVLLAGLAPDRDYYFALQAMDNVGNASDLAVCGPVRTLAASLRVSALADDAERTPRFSGTSSWARSTEQSASPVRSYTDSPGAPYRNRQDTALSQIEPTLLAGYSPVLAFRARTDLERDYDFIHIEISPDDGASWERSRLALTGRTGWTTYSLPLARYYGERVRVRFRLITDALTTAGGVWLDDIQIGGGRLQPLGGAVPGTPAGLKAEGGRRKIVLTWSSTAGTEVVETRIYRSRFRGGPYALRARLGPASTFTDRRLPGRARYYYVVTAVDASGTESDRSNEATAATRAYSR